MSKSHDPQTQIDAGNAWYIDEQFAKQFDRPGPRAVIENRWRVFQYALNEYLNTVQLTSTSMPARILDAGCGDGINLLGLGKMITRYAWNADLYGIDYNPLRVQRSSRLSFVKEVKQSSLDTLPYPDGWFDAVLCNHVLEHISDDKNVLQELKRVIKPGGLFILGVPNEGCIMARLRNHVFQRSIMRTTDHVNFYTEKSISKLLSDVSFKIVRVESAGFFMPHFTVQYLFTLTGIGRRIIRLLGKAWKSQSADLIIISLC